MDKIKIQELKIEDLIPLYDILTNLCRDYTQVVNSYALATGDNKFERISHEMENTIKESQRVFSLREKVKKCMTNQILQTYE